MSETTLATGPRTRHKTFTYHTHLEWGGNRSGLVGSEGKPSFRVASPPEFKGEAGVWTPEDLFVAAVNICMMTTFVAFAQRLDLPVVSYASEADGLLEFEDGVYRFTRVTLRPRILVGSEAAVASVEKALHEAHKGCLISNSIRTVVSVEPTIESWTTREGSMAP